MGNIKIDQISLMKNTRSKIKTEKETMDELKCRIDMTENFSHIKIDHKISNLKKIENKQNCRVHGMVFTKCNVYII